jgi:nucleoside-diphosphate-sugar epimerase
MVRRECVSLFGASGTMGFRAFQELWKRRERYDIVLLLRPSAKNKKRFAPYEQASRDEASKSRGKGLRIVWGDATRVQDAAEAIRGTDWVLNAMALISPQADYYPEQARAVNIGAVRNIVEAIEAEPGGAERIRLVHTGSVAETGDRLGCIHWGRVGDPLKPPVFDYYAVTKVLGERAVLESRIRRWASLRMSYILPTDFRDYLSLLDPILYHLPIATFMENITDRDAGLGMVNCLDIPDDSGFWGRAYNLAGGPTMRCTAVDYLSANFRLMGFSGVEACTERRWFVLRNFHLQYYHDSHILDSYLHFWRDSMDSFWRALYDDAPAAIRALAGLCRARPVRRAAEAATHRVMRHMAEEHRNGPVFWYKHRNDLRISAFFRDYAAYEAIPDWGVDMPQLTPEPECQMLNHGYDESKATLDLDDLRGAAAFRGGECLSSGWGGDLYAVQPWRCAVGHEFTARPYTVLKAGHWCPECLAPPWNYDEEARRNPFFAQVWYPNHDLSERNLYAAECIRDISER